MPEQVPPNRRPAQRPGEFVNTWSVPGFIGKPAAGPAQPDGHHEKRCLPTGWGILRGRAARSIWAAPVLHPGTLLTPLGAPLIGFCCHHPGESITLPTNPRAARVLPRSICPPLHYAYHAVQRRGARCADCSFEWQIRLPQPARGAEDCRRHRRAGRAAEWAREPWALFYCSQLGIDESRDLLGPQFNVPPRSRSPARAAWSVADHHPEPRAVGARGPRSRFGLRSSLPISCGVAVAPIGRRWSAAPRCSKETVLNRDDPWAVSLNFRVSWQHHARPSAAATADRRHGQQLTGPTI